MNALPKVSKRHKQVWACYGAGDGNCGGNHELEAIDGEQLELFPELVAQWEEDARWYTILRERIEDVGGHT